MPHTYDAFEKRLDEMEAKRRKRQEDAMDAAFRKAEKRRKKQEQQRAKAKRHEYEKTDSKPLPPPPPSYDQQRVATLYILGLRADQDNPVAIRSAYRRLALQYHPDKNPSKDATEVFRRVLDAYQTLVG